MPDLVALAAAFEELRFLRPGWLLALPPALLLGWILGRRGRAERRWRRIIAPHLLAHLRVGGEERWRFRPPHLIVSLLPNDARMASSFVVTTTHPSSPPNTYSTRATPCESSACTSASLEPSYVLRALGIPDELAHASLRFSLGRFTSEADVDFAAERLLEVVPRLRAGGG